MPRPRNAPAITTKDGLLWRNGKIIELPEADILARAHGHTCAERMVKALENANGLDFDSNLSPARGITPPVFKDPTLAPSRLKAMSRCPGYIGDAWDKDNEAAEEGSMLHATIEAIIQDRPLPPEYDPENSEHRAMIEYATEVFTQFNTDPNETVEVEAQMQVPYCGRPSRYDLIISNNGHVTVIDWKFGRNVVEHPSENHQMRAYGVGLWMNRPESKSIELILCYPRYKRMDRAPFTLDDHKATLLSLAEQKVKSDDWHSRLNPGDACNWCGRKIACPAVGSAVAEVFRSFGGDVAKMDPRTIDLANPAKLGVFLEAAGVVDGWCKDVKSYASDVMLNQGIDIPGYMIVTKKGSKALTDIHVALTDLQAIMDQHGLGELDFGMLLDHLTPSPDKLTEYLADLYERKHGKKSKGLSDQAEALWETHKILHRNDEIRYLRKS